MNIEEKVRELHSINNIVSRISKETATESSNALLRLRRALEVEIASDLSRGKRIESDPIMDYCINHFHGYRIDGKGTPNYFTQNGREEEREYFTTVFDTVEKVRVFANYIKNSMSKKILSLYGGIPEQIGKISGQIKITHNKNTRQLYVPVEEALIFQNSRWSRHLDGKLNIPRDIFSHFAFSSFATKSWTTNRHRTSIHHDELVKESEIYIGDARVERELKRKREIAITVEKKKFSLPDFNSK